MELEDEFGTEIPDEEAEKSTLLVMLLNLLTVLKNNKSYIWVVSIVDSVFSLIINSFNVKLKMIQEQHIKEIK